MQATSRHRLGHSCPWRSLVSTCRAASSSRHRNCRAAACHSQCFLPGALHRSRFASLASSGSCRLSVTADRAHRRGTYVGEAALAPPGTGPGARNRLGRPTAVRAGRSTGLRGEWPARPACDPVPGSTCWSRAMATRAGSPRTYLALQRLDLLDLRSWRGGPGREGPRADAMARLRVTLRQAVLLTAAGNFARELRLVP